MKLLFFRISAIFLLLSTLNLYPVKAHKKHPAHLSNSVNEEDYFSVTVSINDFGGIGNDTLPDDAAVDAAINAAGKNGTVIFPKGTYFINSAVSSRFEGQKFVGENAKLVLLSASQNAFFISHNYCEVSGFKISGNGLDGKSITAGTSIYLQGASHCSITNNIIEKTSGNGIALMIGANSGSKLKSGCNNNLVESNIISGFNTSVTDISGIIIGYADTVAQNRNTIKSNTIDGGFKCGNGIIILSNGFENEISDNTITNVRRYGIALYHPRNGEHYSIEKNRLTHNIISNVGISSGSNFGSGIYLVSSHHNFIFRNTLNNISLGTTETQLPIGGIALNGSCWNEVSENKIANAIVNGIKVSNSNGNIFNGNSITQSKTGITGQNILETTFSNNELQSLAGEGLQIVCDTFTSALPHLVNAKWGSAINVINNKVNSNCAAFNMAGVQVIISNCIIYNNRFEDSSANTARFSKVAYSYISKNEITSKKKMLNIYFCWQIAFVKIIV